MPAFPDFRRKYLNPPIQEAVCELHFAPNLVVSKEKLAAFGEAQWKTSYPQQEVVEEKSVSLEFALGISKITQQPMGYKLLAKSPDSKDISQLSPGFLAVNRLAPYADWSDFRRKILGRFSDVQKEFGFLGISRANLRYINKIEIPEGVGSWRKWLNFSLPIPAALEIEPADFHTTVRFPLDANLGGIVRLLTFRDVASPERPKVMLDIDINFQSVVPIDELPSTLDKLHAPHNFLFESYITDNLRSAFVPVS